MKKIIKNYISVDIENPNCKGNSICAIGIVIVENGKVIEKKYSLINPEDRFDIQVIRINGIDASMVNGKPTFKEYWNEIEKIITENIIIGHNVQYDLSVISKSLERYNIKVPKFKYYCTLNLSRKHLNYESYKLDQIAQNLGITFKHHNALEDAETTCKIFEYINDNFEINLSELKEYNYNNQTRDNLNSKLSSNINELYGIIQGINYDGEINQKEIDKLKKWVQENLVNKIYTLFNKIITTVEKILEDNVISAYEKIELFKLVESINHSKIYNETTLALQVLEGIISGISCDNIINFSEIQMLEKWLDGNDYLSDVYPYDKICLIVKEVLEDGKLTEEEKEYILNSFNCILNPLNNSNDTFILEDKTFCLTGDFINGTKEEIRKKIISKGGIEKSGVSSKLDYLFVGELGSEAWKFGKLGGKILKAQELIEQGSNMKIISESDLISYI